MGRVYKRYNNRVEYVWKPIKRKNSRNRRKWTFKWKQYTINVWILYFVARTRWWRFAIWNDGTRSFEWPRKTIYSDCVKWFFFRLILFVTRIYRTAFPRLKHNAIASSLFARAHIKGIERKTRLLHDDDRPTAERTAWCVRNANNI